MWACFGREERAFWCSPAGQSKAHRRATDLYQEQQRLHQQFTRAEHRKVEEENLRQQASNARALHAQRARQADREEELAALEEEHRRRFNAIRDAARKDLQATAAMEAEAAALVQEQAENKKKADRDERAFRGESSPPRGPTASAAFCC